MINIKDLTKNIKRVGERTGLFRETRDIYIVILIIVISFMSYGLGRLSTIYESRQAIRIENLNQPALIGASGGGAIIKSGDERPVVEIGGPPAASGKKIESVTPTFLSQPGGQYVGSKSSDKYHLPWCSGAKRIKEENKIWFATKEEAEQAGYVPASNCKGL